MEVKSLSELILVLRAIAHLNTPILIKFHVRLAIYPGIGIKLLSHANTAQMKQYIAYKLIDAQFALKLHLFSKTIDAIHVQKGPNIVQNMENVWNLVIKSFLITPIRQ